MRAEFIKYMESVGITKVLRERIETIYECCKVLCVNEITGIFITDYIKQDGTREYESLWFFSDKNCMEAKQFIPPDGKAWVDHIRTKGNEATHEIAIMKKEDAEELIIFIEMLLKIIYEFPETIKKKESGNNV